MNDDDDWRMIAVRVEQLGGPEVLVPVRVPAPVARAGEVVVEVAAVHVLFVETQLRRGWGHEHFDMRPPYVPGGAVAGIVAAVGEHVDPHWVGRRVVARTSGQGGYAQLVRAPLALVVPIPDAVGLVDAAVLVHDGSTALRLYARAGVRRGEWVLVLGAAGGLGLMLTQLAVADGARVLAAARGERKLALARRQGVDAAVDYTHPDWVEQLREATDGHGVDVVFDGVGGDIGRDAFALTRRGARFSAHGAPSGAFSRIDARAAARRGVIVSGIEHARFSPDDARSLAEQALALAARERIRPSIGLTLALERAAEAHAAIEARSVAGSTVLLP